jgi:hypothetical protein
LTWQIGDATWTVDNLPQVNYALLCVRWSSLSGIFIIALFRQAPRLNFFGNSGVYIYHAPLPIIIMACNGAMIDIISKDK